MQSDRFYRTLYGQVLMALALGAVFGLCQPTAAAALKPLCDGFIRSIKMLIAPLIFTTLVMGIGGSGDGKKVGRTGALALVYFEVVSTLALLLGLCVINLLRPGAGMNVDTHTLDATQLGAAAPVAPHSFSSFVLDVIPHSFVGAFAQGELLPVLLLSILFGVGLQRTGGREGVLFSLLERLSQVLFAMVGMVMRLSPLGAFGAMAFTVGRYGLGSLLPLAKLMATFYATCLLFVFGVLGAIARAHGFSLVRLIRYFRDELLIVLGTASSEAVLPRMLSKLEALGASRSSVGLVLPTGYSFNLDGTSIYLTMAAVFVAQATNTPLGWAEQLGLLAVSLLASKGAAAVSGSAFIVLTATVSTLGTVPVAGLTLLLGIDRFMSEARALTNLIGNAVATLVVAKWTGELNAQQLAAALADARPAAVRLSRLPCETPVTEPTCAAGGGT